VLRITEQRRGPNLTRLRLDGRVVGEWVPVLARACESVRAAGLRLELDLAGISFLDSDAVRLVKRLVRAGATVSGSSGFVREQIGGGGHGSSAVR
jgi:hypothetical protein